MPGKRREESGERGGGEWQWHLTALSVRPRVDPDTIWQIAVAAPRRPMFIFIIFSPPDSGVISVAVCWSSVLPKL